MIQKVRGYIFSRPFMGERVPQHIQNLVIRDYCDRHNLHYLLSATEYAMTGSHLILEQVINELPDLDGVVAYSLFQLPEDPLQRQLIYDKTIELNKRFYFAVEGLQMGNSNERDRIETLWRIRQTLPNCLALGISQ